MTEKIKTPVLKPEYILPELESENGYQSLELEFRDESNDLNIEQLIGNRRYLIPCLSIQIISYTKID